MRKSNKKKLLKRKDGERYFHFPSCPPDVQGSPQRDEAHRMEKVDELQRRCYFDG